MEKKNINRKHNRRGKLVFCCAAILLMLFLSSCGERLEDVSEIKPDVNEPQIQENSVESEVLEFNNEHLCFSYEQSVFEVNNMSEDSGGFVVSVTKRGEDAYSVPRIDIVSMSMAGFSEGDINNSYAEITAGYEDFIYGMLSNYYSVSVSEDGTVAGAPVVSFSDTAAEAEGRSKHCYTKATIQKTDDYPDMVLEAECLGTDNGICILSFYQKDLDDQSVELLNQVIRTIRYEE